MSRPVIGLSCYLEPAQWGAWQMPAALVPHWYVDMLHDSGADVVLLPPENDAVVLDRLDGLALAGGADVDARLYGAAPDDTADAPREARDSSELALYRRARDLGMLVQHLPDVEGTITHRERPGAFVDHVATFADSSRAGAIFGPGEVVVNSSHHQSVASAGDLVVSGWAADGTIEACEDPAADFCLGVQWHPEHPDRRQPDRVLLGEFVAAADRYRARTVPVAVS